MKSTIPIINNEIKEIHSDIPPVEVERIVDSYFKAFRKGISDFNHPEVTIFGSYMKVSHKKLTFALNNFNRRLSELEDPEKIEKLTNKRNKFQSILDKLNAYYRKPKFDLSQLTVDGEIKKRKREQVIKF